MVYKKVQWFADTLNIYRKTVENILDYLKIECNARAEYPVSALPTIQQFYETHDCRTFFNSMHAEINKQHALEKLRQNPDIIVLRDLVDYADQVKHWRLVALLNNRNIKVYRQQNVAYISKEDYNRLKSAFDDVINGAVHVRSHPEQEVFDFIQSIYSGELRRNVRGIIPPCELDIYAPNLHIAVEFNGQYWHSDISGTSKKYHEDKSLKCEAQGIRLIHIYEWEWNDDILRAKIQTILRSAFGKTAFHIPARKCVVREISNSIARQFNNTYHLQSHRNAQITYGLFYNDKLVQLMSFSRSRYNRNLNHPDAWEIIRSCTCADTIVVGGLSRLFSHFIHDNQPSTVFSYCDFNKFDGKGYVALGMKFIGYTGPNMWWLMPDNSIMPRSPSRHHELKSQSLGKIWGSGSKKYIWEMQTADELRT